MFSSAASSTSVRVTTYNILSSKLARKDHFQACKEEDLKPYVRYERIVRKLEAEVKKNAVISLQEVRTLQLGAKKVAPRASKRSGVLLCGASSGIPQVDCT